MTHRTFVFTVNPLKHYFLIMCIRNRPVHNINGCAESAALRTCTTYLEIIAFTQGKLRPMTCDEPILTIQYWFITDQGMWDVPSSSAPEEGDHGPSFRRMCYVICNGLQGLTLTTFHAFQLCNDCFICLSRSVLKRLENQMITVG